MTVNILNVVEHFKSGIDGRVIGVYYIEVIGNETRKATVTRNGNKVMAILHSIDGDTLHPVTESVRNAVIQSLEMKGVE